MKTLHPAGRPLQRPTASTIPSCGAPWHVTEEPSPALEAECQRLRQQLKEQEHLQQQLLDAIPVPFFYKDTQLRYHGCNEAFAQALGLSRLEIIGRSAADLVPAALAEHYHNGDLQTLAHGSQFYEGAIPYADGRCRDVLFHKKTYRHLDGSIGGVVGSFQDITRQRSAEREIFRLAHFDALTGLANRHHFQQQLAQLLAGFATQVVVLAVDLDNFKILHDTLGHDFCNRLLVQAGTRLQEYVGRHGLAARLGEDKFALVCKDALGGGEHAAQQVLALFTEPFVLGRQPVHVTACVGVAPLGAVAETADSLLRGAEIALRQAKGLGRGSYCCFDGAFDCDVLDDIVLEADLRHALRRQELHLVYQPQVDLASRQLVGFEALLRWQHPERGLIPPDRFIPIAEQSGQIHEIGTWLLGEACRQNRTWQAAGIAPLRMAVNLSGSQLKQDGFVTLVQQILADSGLDPCWLELELTESTVMEHTESSIRLLDELKALGIHLSVDDFGTGYSSLAYLKRFPLDKIKIDRSFIRELPQSAEDGAIVEAIIAMAHRLGMRIVAEGIETEVQVEFLRRQGCELAQGYLFGRPLPLAAAEQLARKSFPG